MGKATRYKLLFGLERASQCFQKNLGECFEADMNATTADEILRLQA